ncbi:type VII secretion target [Nocardia bovistercoris]|uniref:ESX-1 secretion-associated protein n=1 Tax=Nocardia bovistercoris TaxID=2785916 RepID=A0A931N234_9NOCA|nr:type VII secretion target [Nocardia bovistercoris]MBH0775596.1 hypothetical protein [Nocardia bovistercoris]
MTYQFTVVPDDIAEAADELSDLGAGSTKAVDYARNHLNLEGNAGVVLKPLIGVLKEACDEFATNYTRLGTRTSEAAAELAKAATMYRNLDRNRAEALDRTYPAKGGK